MTAAEFQEALRERSDEQLLDPCLRDDQAPFVFDGSAERWNAFKQELREGLGVAEDAVRIIGSGRFGFSLKPWNKFREFRDNSDVDVVIVSSDLFDVIWVSLLEAVYPRPPLTEKLGGWIKNRRDEVYTGWLSPLTIRVDPKIVGAKAAPVLEFSTRWFNTFKLASRHPVRRHEDVKGRLYRTWRHAELYHVNSLAELRRSLEN